MERTTADAKKIPDSITIVRTYCIALITIARVTTPGSLLSEVVDELPIESNLHL